jgi:hypothetical protein
MKLPKRKASERKRRENAKMRRCEDARERQLRAQSSCVWHLTITHCLCTFGLGRNLQSNRLLLSSRRRFRLVVSFLTGDRSSGSPILLTSLLSPPLLPQTLTCLIVRTPSIPSFIAPCGKASTALQPVPLFQSLGSPSPRRPELC